eukprot:TRINITY_DN14698_c0_g1_i1.p1 TRINITY_DN14698_c0_g1~~TRINITY_DN14698_c0_g1_i1.p1  ORF type:complete len:266 (-),score=35.47 TRINITY_DN14698_c0_g1_i1:11-775(-)
MKALRVLLLRNFPVLKQLHLEERIWRRSKDAWLIVNEGTNTPAVILGRGHDTKEINTKNTKYDGVDIVQRFTGGGNVYVDHNTLFITHIGQEPQNIYPADIIDKTAKYYTQVFPKNVEFEARENDFVSGEYKFGGNAQRISRGSWLQHTSFLWDFDPEKLDRYLRLPQRTPQYRRKRSHADFLTNIKTLLDSEEAENLTLSAFTKSLVNPGECAKSHSNISHISHENQDEVLKHYLTPEPYKNDKTARSRLFHY